MISVGELINAVQGCARPRRWVGARTPALTSVARTGVPNPVVNAGQMVQLNVFSAMPIAKDVFEKRPR